MRVLPSLDGRFEMKSENYDIVRQNDQQSAIWLEAVADLNTATSRIQQLASFWPGEFCVMDQRSHHIIAHVNDRPQKGEHLRTR